MEIIGLIPAGGTASRLGRIPCSKEVFPLVRQDGKMTVTSAHLIRYFEMAGIRNIYFIMRKGKWDIPEYFGDGTADGVNIGYLMMNKPYGTPFTLDQAYPFVSDKIVALGFPDILFEPEDAFCHVKDRLLSGNADIALGIVPSKEYLNSDMIELDEKGKIMSIVIKQDRPDLKYSWFIALWRPSFTHYIHEYLEIILKNNPDGKMKTPQGIVRELFIGDVIQSALDKGFTVDHILFPEGNYLDLGTADRLSGRAGDKSRK